MDNIFGKKENIHDVSKYSDEELYQILNLTNPTDRELEAKILHYIHKYTNMGNETGNQLAQFFVDIYSHFFELDEDDYQQYGILPTALISNGSADDNVEDTHEPNKMKEGLENMSEGDPTTTPPSGNDNPFAGGNGVVPEIKMIEYKKDKLNPLLKETISRTISIDSQYRTNKLTPSTSFTFNLSEPLRDVVAMRLYSYQIPYTWYTVNNSFGGNFFLIKGNADGINNGNHDYKITIAPGNYTPSNLVIAINNSISNLSTTYTDVDFGDTGITYNTNNALATMNIDIVNIYNTSHYYLEFPDDPLVPPPGNQQYLGKYLGFNYKNYGCSSLVSARDLPLIDNAANSSDNVASIYMVNASNYTFHIVLYSGNNYDNDNISSIIIHENIPVSLTLVGGGSNTRNSIVNNLNAVLLANPKLDANSSSIERIDINNAALENNQKSFFRLNISLNRKTTRNVEGAKLAIIFPAEQSDPNHSPLWVGNNSCFHFEYLENELNSVFAETEMKQSNYLVTGDMEITLKCILYPFDVPYNDYRIVIPNSTSEGYVLSNYISTINTSIVTANTLYSISDDKNDFNYPKTNAKLDVNNYLNFTFDLNRVFRNRYYNLEMTHKYFGNVNMSLGVGNVNVNNFTNTFNIGSYILDINDVIRLVPKTSYGFVGNISAGTIELTIEQLLNVQDGNNTVAVNQHPKYVRYFKMLAAGFNAGYVKSQMIVDGKNANLLDTPDALIPQVKTSITYASYSALQNALNDLFIQFRDYFGNMPFSNSRVSITTKVVGSDVKLNAEMSLIIAKTISQLNYIVNYVDPLSTTEQNNRWKTDLFLDVSYNLSQAILIENGSSVIKNNSPITDNEILIENGINNYFYLKPYADIDGLYTENGSYAVKIEIPPRSYSRNTLYTAINIALQENELTKMSSISDYDENGKEYTMFNMNIYKVFKTKDYRVVFYDPYTFSSCDRINKTIKTATWDSTIGWLLGFREMASYFLEDFISSPTKSMYYDSVNPNKCVLISDTCITVSLFNYFMIILDDYNQNHLNDGLVTTSMPERLIDLGKNYKYVCEPVTGEKVISSIGDNNSANQLTASQIYSNNQKYLAKKVKTLNYSSVPFVKDIFALIPISTSKYENGSFISELSGSLQVQERVYFGPVNIQRMSVKLVNDRGDLVDLNNSNWSFSVQATLLIKSDIP